ncbi:hypothetical protein EDC45_1532 [Mesocricetibacter intestinalis]|uniref:SIMPL domain-containing protein n=1 Tax=Mesocricetibacter intestinalis TaxID=1521930 RepID=A0A4R6V7H6_9PAST|nr:SIMPL domain-containing protein [Mesocricetibacter intestinalis]TDQ57139.1 hypothetical protein EDC45_1532 [Mesocricetibacter intestinalis]
MQNSNKTFYSALFGVILALGLMASSFILGQQFKNLRQSGVITVKGLAEAEYKASYGTWTVSVENWGADYKTAMTENARQLEVARAFLAKQGFSAQEVSLNPLDVYVHTETYTDEKGKEKTVRNGYDARRTLSIASKDLAKLQRALDEINNLRAENQAVNFSSPSYYLENLETIKRELISKATQDAYVRAQEFAKTSNINVGVLRSASQGSFDISANLPDAESQSDYGGGYDTSTIDKKVRLVVTIQYDIN